MAINLATKYADQIASVFTAGSFVKGKTANTFDLTGVKTLKVYTPITVEETDYVRDGLSRYGTPTEMQDTVQELKMTQDKSFTLTIDKGNNLDQNLAKRAADMLRLQLSEKSTPAADRYALRRFATLAGTVEEAAAVPSKSNIVSLLARGAQVLDDALVPDDNRYVYLTSELYKYVCTSDEFTGVPALGEKSLAKGVVGEIFGMQLVRVPKSYLPENCYFILTHRAAVLLPYKISDAKVHEDPVGVSGALIEGRHYYDAFVLGAKCAGVYALVAADKTTKTPAIEVSGQTATITCATSGAAIRYTVDGSDPRYSDSAKEYVSAVTLASGEKARAYAVGTGLYPSAVAAQ
ncbi:MAG: hypothetical protein EOM63_06580 [Clostridia bacterium]|nr:hypothetical protein [Clostridia bacterium]